MDLKTNEGTAVESSLTDFDTMSGSIVERALFNNRPFILTLFFLLTLFFGYEACHVRLNADFNKMIPTDQPFIMNFLQHYDDLQSQGNAIQIAVQTKQGTITNAHYLDVLKQINDQVYLLSNVDRAFMTSLWTPTTRWTAVTGDGFASGAVIGDSYDGSKQQLDIVFQNIINTGRVGELVSNDFTSSMIHVPLLQFDGLTGQSINYGQLAQTLNELRAKYAAQGVTLHIIGFGMVVGDMINDIDEVVIFFALSAIIATTVLYWYTHCIRSTLLVVMASLVAVVWQMGMLALLGFDLSPYSVLVPFLVFAIGMSHGAQKMNGVMQDIGRGVRPVVAARFTFRRLFLAGFAALVCDASSFAVLMVIHIVAIRELSLLASIGVAILIFTNLIMLPMSLSYTGVSAKAALRSLRGESVDAMLKVKHPVWHFLDKFTTRRYASLAIMIAFVLGGFGLIYGRNIQVGDLSKGAPELRQDSQYNRDNSYITDHYTSSSDTFIVLVDTKNNACLSYTTLSAMNRLQWQLEQLPVVQSTFSAASYLRSMTMLLNENVPKWFGLDDNQPFLNNVWQYVPRTLINFSCTFDPIYVSLTDHKAATLNAVVNLTKGYIENPKNRSPEFSMSMAGGNAGIAAATNISIARASHIMLLLVYGTVTVFCFIVFRSWRAVLCAVIPLALTSILAQALMVWLGIGIKVATLPVTALGVGIGVDYALYVLGIVLKQMRAGASLSVAYHRTLLFTGKVVILTGFTLSAGVVTWIFAPIKFQADMGLLLSFMFLWNMVGAMVLLPSLAYFLLPPRLFVTPKEIR